MIGLAVSGSPYLLQAIDRQQVQVDYLNVGQWMGAEWFRKCCHRQPVLLHCNEALIDPEFNSQSILDTVAETQTPWVSLHLEVPYLLWKRLGIPISRLNRAKAHSLALTHLDSLQKKCPIPVAIENQAYHRACGHDYLVRPDFINRVVAESSAKLLLDIAHARVSAAMLGLDARNYIAQLSLNNIIEIHISGAGLYRGRLRDLHNPLETADYELLEWVLPRCPNLGAVTLEYDHAGLLLEQIQRLQEMIAG